MWRHLAESNRSPELCRLLYNRSTKAPEPWHYRDYSKNARRRSLQEKISYYYETLFYCFSHFRKHSWILYREVRERRAIESDTFLVETVDECRIGETVETSRIIDTDIPEASEISFLLLSTNIGIDSRFQESGTNMRVYISIHTTKSLRPSDEIRVSSMSRKASFYPCHNKKLKK